MASLVQITSSIVPVALPEDLEERVIDAVTKAIGPSIGKDSDDFRYLSIAHCWDVERSRRAAVDSPAEAPAWYSDAQAYWDGIPPTVDGMLGGFEVLTKEDVKGSKSFLQKLWKKRPELGRGCAVDCGAGIGRVTKNLLLPLFEKVHLLEQSAPLIESAPNFLGKDGATRTTLLCQGMQAFEPSPATYDVVWVQWVIGHLTDADLVTFLWRCKAALKPGGVICVKDNTFGTSTDENGALECFCVDREDSSLTRSTEYFEAIFKFAGLEVLQKETQRSFPEGLYPVLMYALC